MPYDPQTAILTTELRPSGAGVLSLDAAEIKVTKGPDRGQRVALGADSLTIGSHSTCDLVLHDRQVSSRHAEIQVTTEGYLLRDLGSKNGIRIGKWLVGSAPLMDGMRLALGESILSVRKLGRRLDLPLAEAGESGELIARSVKMRLMIAMLEKLAVADISVLIEGETGSGKELAARTLHDQSPREAGPFVIVDCAAIPAELMAAELFGYERGAFTGATEQRRGLFEEAEGGTLFFDEVGELPLQLQAHLLGAIERRRSRRVGGNRDISHDLRVVAATHRNLAEEVRQGRFREDLYHRLAAARLRVPPLREREEDLPILAERFAVEEGVQLTPELMRLIRSYHWPGNVRELRNAIMRAAVLPGPLELDHLATPTARDGGELPPLSEARQRAMDEFERGYLEQALQAAGGQMKRAAELASVSRQFFMRLAAKHKLRRSDRVGGG